MRMFGIWSATAVLSLTVPGASCKKEKEGVQSLEEYRARCEQMVEASARANLPCWKGLDDAPELAALKSRFESTYRAKLMHKCGDESPAQDLNESDWSACLRGFEPRCDIDSNKRRGSHIAPECGNWGYRPFVDLYEIIKAAKTIDEVVAFAIRQEAVPDEWGTSNASFASSIVREWATERSDSFAIDPKTAKKGSSVLLEPPEKLVGMTICLRADALSRDEERYEAIYLGALRDFEGEGSAEPDRYVRLDRLDHITDVTAGEKLEFCGVVVGYDSYRPEGSEWLRIPVAAGMARSVGESK